MPDTSRTDLPENAGDKWTPQQVYIVGLCCLIHMLDGADMLIMSFIAPVLAREWAISPERLGAIFSASLLGMTFGCIFVAPLADRFGRRNLVLVSLSSIALAMSSSGIVGSVNQLLIVRFIVGLFVGVVLVSLSAVAAETAPERHANFAVGLVHAGWPLGSVLTAIIAARLLPQFGWKPLLVGLGVGTVVLLFLAISILPESRRTSVISQSSSMDRLKLVFGESRARTTLLLWLSVTLGFFVLYFVISWIPKLATQAGLPVDQAIYAGAAYNLGAFFGTTLIGWAAVRFPINRVIPVFLLCAPVAMLTYGGVKMPVLWTLLFAVLVGITVNGGFNGFFVLTTRFYPPAVRGTGVGWTMGIGRMGAVLGPLAGGYLVAAKLSIFAIFAVYSVPLVIVAMLCFAMPTSARSE